MIAFQELQVKQSISQAFAKGNRELGLLYHATEGNGQLVAHTIRETVL
jgi:hypothetical protein